MDQAPTKKYYSKLDVERLISCRRDREIYKKLLVRGDFALVPYEDARCKIRLSEVECRDQNGPCEINVPESRIFNPPFDGNVIIGDSDSFLDKDFELILQQMTWKEVATARMIYKNTHGDLMREITCKIHIIDITEEQLISDWSWARLYESALHHKERGIKLVKEKRIVDGFRRFSKSLKMLVAMEPVDENIMDEERVKEMINMRVKLFNNMAHCQLQFNEYGATVDLTSRALRYDYNNAKALYRRSIAYVGLKMYEEAWDDIQKILDTDPNDKAALQKAKELRPHVERINKDYAKVIKKMFG